ncbi:MAG: oligosaccharide flippase family protein [Puniceicoccaceae bacterium]
MNEEHTVDYPSSPSELRGALPFDWFGLRPSPRPVLSGVRYGAFALVQLASVVVLSRLLDPEIFGLMATVQFFLLFLGQFNATTFSTSIVQQEEVTHEQASGLFWINCVTGLFLFAIMAGIGYPLAVFIGQPVLFPVAIVLGCFFFLNALSAVHMALLERHRAYRRLMLIQVSGGLFGLAVAVLMAIFGLGIWALVGQTLLATLVWIWLSWRLVKWVPGRPERHVGLKRMLRTGIQANADKVMTCLTQNIQPLLLAKLAGPLEAGYFNRGQVVFQRPLNQLLQPLVTLLFPKLATEQAEENDDYEPALHKANFIQAFILLPLLVLFICYSDVLIPLLLGRNFHLAGPIVKWLAIGFVPMVLVGELPPSPKGYGGQVSPSPKGYGGQGSDTPKGFTGLSKLKFALGAGLGNRLPVIGLPILILAMIWAARHGAISVAIVVTAYHWILTFPKAWLQLKELGLDMSRYLASVEIRGLQVVGLIALAFFMRQWISNWSVISNIGLMVGFLAVAYVLVAASLAAFKDGREILEAAKEWWKGRNNL